MGTGVDFPGKGPFFFLFLMLSIFMGLLSGIEDELASYNPLIPDGRNWKVTLLIEFTDETERREALAQLKGVEDRCWVQVEGQLRVFAIADEDLERENELEFYDSTAGARSLRRRGALR